MEHTWIFYALGGMLLLGTGSFIKKLVISLGRDKDTFLLTTYLLYVPFFLINAFFRGEMNFDSDILTPGCIIGFLNFIIPLGTLTSLKYLNVSFALVSSRLVASSVLLLLGVIVLGDSLSLYNYFGFVLGACSIVLLSGLDFSSGKFHWKGMIGLLMNIIATIISHAYFKYVVEEVNIPDFMAIQFTVAFLCIITYMTLRGKIHKIGWMEIKKCLPFSSINFILYTFLYLYFLPQLYIYGPLSLGYKMLSYSLVVPIVLSVIFLGEPINRTRIFAFGLTIISIFLFLV